MERDKQIRRHRRGAPLGNQNALKTGRYTAKAKAERRLVSALIREARRTMAAMCESA